MKGKRVKITIVLSGLALVFAGFNYLLLANSRIQQDPEPSSSAPNISSLVLQTIAFVGLIIILIYASIYILRRFVYNRPHGRSGSALKILNISPLIPKKSVCVVKMVDRILVLGLTETAISPLAEIKDPETRNEWEKALELPSSRSSSAFAKKLSSLMGSQSGH